ncbi:hypothetical protein D9M69_585850 [compost metagenome]
MVDLGKGTLALVGNTLAFADPAGEIDGVAVDDGAAHAGPRFDALNTHGILLEKSSFGKRPRAKSEAGKIVSHEDAGSLKHTCEG